MGGDLFTDYSGEFSYLSRNGKCVRIRNLARFNYLFALLTLKAEKPISILGGTQYCGYFGAEFVGLFLVKGATFKRHKLIELIVPVA